MAHGAPLPELAGPGGAEGGQHIDVSSDGGTVVVASSSWLDGVDSLLTRSYGSSGTENWTAREEGPDGQARLTGLAVAAGGSVYLSAVGTTVDSSTGSLTVAYGPTGGPASWTSFIEGTKRGDGGNTVALAPDGSSVFVSARLAADIRTDAFMTA